MRARQRGQSVVEFGLIALLFTLLLFGIADFGLLLNGWGAVSSNARDGARRASAGAHVTDIVTAIRGGSQIPGVARSDLKIAIRYCPQIGGSCTTYCSGTPA